MAAQIQVQVPAVSGGAPGATAPQFVPTSLYVGDLEWNVTDSQLYDLFNQLGQVVSVRVCRDLSTRRSLGYGYVNYANPQDAARAMEMLKFTPLNGKGIRIMYSHRDPSVRKSGSGNIFIQETYQSLMIERYGEDLNNHPPHDHELWLKACGGRKKGRLIGASDADDPIFVLTGTPGIESGDGSSCGSRQIDVQVEKLQKTVVDMEEERAERKKEIEALEQANERERLEPERIEKELNDYRAETNKKLALLFAHLEPPHP